MSTGGSIATALTPPAETLGYVVAVGIAATVGAADILKRYKESPWLALTTGWGLWFVVANGAFGWAAFFGARVLRIVNLNAATAGDAAELLKVGIIVGFGAIVILRSVAFKFSVGGASGEAGAATIVDSLLAAIDQSIGHEVARKKDEIVRKIMAGVSYDKSRSFLPQYCLSLLEQNTEFQVRNAALSSRVGAVVKDIDDTARDTSLSDSERAHLLGSVLITTFGEHVVRSAVKGFKAELGG